MIKDEKALIAPPEAAGGLAKSFGNIDDVLAKMAKSGAGTPATKWNNLVEGTDLQGLEYD